MCVVSGVGRRKSLLAELLAVAIIVHENLSGVD